MSIATILGGLIVLFVVVSVLRFVLAIIGGVKHRNDPDPPLYRGDL